MHLVHRFELSTKIRGSESEELVTLGFLEQKTAYEILRSDWSSDVCSSDLDLGGSPHKERDLIGEDVDLDLLYLSLKGIQESWEGERDRKLKEEVNNVENELGELGNLWGRRPLK